MLLSRIERTGDRTYTMSIRHPRHDGRWHPIIRIDIFNPSEEELRDALKDGLTKLVEQAKVDDPLLEVMK